MNQEEEKTDLKTNDAIAGFKKVSEVLAELRLKYTGLVVKGIDDKEGYEAIKAAKSDLTSKRTSVEPIKKALTESARSFVDAVNAEAKRIIAELKEIEAPIIAEKERIDALIAQAKQDKLDAELNEYNRRINLCISEGMIYTKQMHEGKEREVYTIGNIVVTPSQIKLSDIEKFDRFILAVKKENEAAMLKRQEEQAAAKAEKERLKAEQEALKKAQADLEARQKDLEQAEIYNQNSLNAAEQSLMERAKEIEAKGQAIEQARTEITKIWTAPEPVRCAEEAVEENNYAHGIPDEARLKQFATYLEFNMVPMVPNCTEEWAIPIADKMREQFSKMATYIRDRCPVQS